MTSEDVMTEEAWLSCTNLEQTLAWLRTSGRVNERKRYLLDAALWASALQTRSAIR